MLRLAIVAILTILVGTSTADARCGLGSRLRGIVSRQPVRTVLHAARSVVVARRPGLFHLGRIAGSSDGSCSPTPDPISTPVQRYRVECDGNKCRRVLVK